MFDIFRKYLSGQACLTGKEFELIQSLSVENKIAKRRFLLREGEISRHLIFITKGLLRHYRTNDKGDEYIFRFATENSWISDRESYLSGNPSNSNIDTIEDSEILIWKKEDFDFLKREIPALQQFMKTLVTKHQLATQNRIYTSISLSAKEKYLGFIESHPAIFNRVPLRMVASYLGVTRETLSRIGKCPAYK